MPEEPEIVTDVDPFEGYAPLDGLEHLGRAIVDANGVPSGSPANFENLRGMGSMNLVEKQAAVDAALAMLRQEYPPEP